jgi:hypothetical protein
MEVKLLVFLTVSIVCLAMVVRRYKSYKYDTSDMAYVTKFRVFSLAIILLIVAGYAVVKLVTEMLKQ